MRCFCHLKNSVWCEEDRKASWVQKRRKKLIVTIHMWKPPWRRQWPLDTKNSDHCNGQLRCWWHLLPLFQCSTVPLYHCSTGTCYHPTPAFFCLSLLPSSSSIEIANYVSWSFAPEVLGVRQIFVLRFCFRFGRLCFLRDFLAFIASVMQLEGRPPMPPWYPWQGHSCCWRNRGLVVERKDMEAPLPNSSFTSHFAPPSYHHPQDMS